MSTATQAPTWYILGAGAIGSLWAAYWQLDGGAPCLIRKQLLADNRLTLQREPQPAHTQTIAQCTLSQLLAERPPIARLLLCTKAQHGLNALRPLLPLLTRDAQVLVVQNGMGVMALRELLVDCALYAGSSTDGAYLADSGSVVHAGRGQTAIGPINALARARALGELPSGLSIQHCDDIEQRLWQKLAINCAINALTVKYQCRNGELLHHEQARREIAQLCRECQQVAAALQLGDWFAQLEQHVHQVLVQTAQNYSSMLQDWRGGRETEIAQINGYLCAQAEQLGIATPANRALCDWLSRHHSLR